jgi:hypothetical protein
MENHFPLARIISAPFISVCGLFERETIEITAERVLVYHAYASI